MKELIRFGLVSFVLGTVSCGGEEGTRSANAVTVATSGGASSSSRDPTTGGTAVSGVSTAGAPTSLAGAASVAVAGMSGLVGAAGETSQAGHPGFWVEGRELRDPCGEKVVLRGVNEMVIWGGSRDGRPFFDEIAKTGANVVRIVWNTTGSVKKLEAAIQNALAAQMIPMPELHDATGDLTKLPQCVDYWVRSDVAAVLLKYQDRLIVNIANEVGHGSVTRNAWRTAYESAIERMRAAGIHVPLVIDAPTWGQNVNMLQSEGPTLIKGDPDHNLVFSVHMWWDDPNGSRVTTELNESVALNLPLIVGEFAQHAVYKCSSAPFDYHTLLALAQELEVGWLAWSWGGVKNNDCATDGPFDMTTKGTFDTLEGWGLEVAVTDPNSILNTSVRSQYLKTGRCD